MQQLLKRHGKRQLDPEMQELQRRVEDRALIRRSSSAHRVWTCKKKHSRKLRWRWEMFWLEEIGLQIHYLFHAKAGFALWMFGNYHGFRFLLSLGVDLCDLLLFYFLALLGEGSPLTKDGTDHRCLFLELYIYMYI